MAHFDNILDCHQVVLKDYIFLLNNILIYHSEKETNDDLVLKYMKKGKL